jgi:hypothetical protein
MTARFKRNGGAFLLTAALDRKLPVARLCHLTIHNIHRMKLRHDLARGRPPTETSPSDIYTGRSQRFTSVAYSLQSVPSFFGLKPA